MKRAYKTCIVLIFLVILMTGCGKSEETATERQETTVTQSGQVEIIKSTVGLHHEKYVRGDQAAIVQGEIKNTGQKYVGDIEIKGTFYDDRGYKIGEGSTKIEFIRPEEKRPFSVLGYVDYEAVDFTVEIESSTIISPEKEMMIDLGGLRVIGEKIVSRYPTAQERLSFSGSLTGRQWQWLEIELYNPGDRRVGAEVLGTFYDSAGRVLDFHTSYGIGLSLNEVGTVGIPCTLCEEIYDYTWIWSYAQVID